MDPDLTHRGSRGADGIRLHYVEAGEGPPVVLLHGFPDFWYGWRHQLLALGSAGFRAVAPDLRGYNRSSRPRGLRRYRLPVLVGDVLALIEGLKAGPLTLVGHDWGGILAWYAAMARPGLLRRLVILNAPHPGAYKRAVCRLSLQVLRSAYAGFFQLPGIPEQVLRVKGGYLLRRAWRTGPAPTERAMARYVNAYARPYALTAALNYYRAALRYPTPRVRHIDVPVRILWGDRDPFLEPSLVEDLDPWMSDVHVERLPQTGHWVQHRESGRTNRFLKAVCAGDI